MFLWYNLDKYVTFAYQYTALEGVAYAVFHDDF